MTVVDLEQPQAPDLSPPAPAARRRRGAHRSRIGHRRLLTKLALAAACIVGLVWTGLLPQQLGGRMSYVITEGISMLPHFHAGDLVILRKEPSYHVGEVAAFHNGELGVVVMHRIVAIHGDHYVFKGDNNDFVTTYEPTKAQIVGAEWLHLPRVGTYLLRLRDPLIAAVLLGLLWLYSFAPRSKSRRQRRRHRHASQ
jgi:signal peptidase I